MRITLSQLSNSLVLSVGFLATAQGACIPAHHKAVQRAIPSTTTVGLDSTSFHAIESAARSILADAKSQISRMIDSVHAEAAAHQTSSSATSHAEIEDVDDAATIITNLKFHNGKDHSSEFIRNLHFGEDRDGQDTKDLASSLTFARLAKNVDESIHDLHFNLRK